MRRASSAVAPQRLGAEHSLARLGRQLHRFLVQVVRQADDDGVRLRVVDRLGHVVAVVGMSHVRGELVCALLVRE